MKAAILFVGTAGVLVTATRDQPQTAADFARAIVGSSKECFASFASDEASYTGCTEDFCGKQCSRAVKTCQGVCVEHAAPLFAKFNEQVAAAEPENNVANRANLQAQVKQAAGEQAQALLELEAAQKHMRRLNTRIANRAEKELRSGNATRGAEEMVKLKKLTRLADQIDEHIANVAQFRNMTNASAEKIEAEPAPSFLQLRGSTKTIRRAPEDELAKEMTHDLEMNFNKIAPFGKEDTAKELQDHAAKTQDTLVDAVENAEVAEIKRAVFRALTRLRAATIKEFDTIARLETQAIDAYNDAHHYRAENPLAHLHEDEAPVETDKLKSFH